MSHRDATTRGVRTRYRHGQAGRERPPGTTPGRRCLRGRGVAHALVQHCPTAWGGTERRPALRSVVDGGARVSSMRSTTRRRPQRIDRRGGSSGTCQNQHVQGGMTLPWVLIPVLIPASSRYESISPAADGQPGLAAPIIPRGCVRRVRGPWRAPWRRPFRPIGPRRRVG